ncbi:hypothetical protein B484DRAFT_443865 [Ochromonadaceae sp. CCMP2298]|nr:hypothetical protein B484DRAFT_443865 [Ochromonadaceae sp. CCMP2298]|mmetsp:Transcript_25123/g.55725  ORF Transcript_25123/g.55725 Transcript_25123/m.55725 type:complete len:125 (-) Transcript_25123:312-686(-)|eukprot:CAMPEP_0173192492 /NCGR_PEP_ID=MMETSP1141-20130122/13447_1 /TAXON_ID=483371 /ORGANISM="non described non described, Strain CCMP2298" /LENGTH=124 /DNA_ID=CAMNT_0014116751 /DNA_START=92 /DNA_END=466 /DNA_ORIENTATION=-
MLLLLLLLLIALACTWAEEFIVDADSGMMHLPKSCFHTCVQGACLFRSCTEPQCPGGACLFVDCTSPSCAGGACIFERGSGSTCDGGSCTYRQPQETLKAGYCAGGNCNIEGQEHPDMHNYLTT